MNLIFVILGVLAVYFFILLVVNKRRKKGRGGAIPLISKENKAAPIAQHTVEDLQSNLKKVYLYGETEEKFEDVRPDNYKIGSEHSAAFDSFFNQKSILTENSGALNNEDLAIEQFSEPDYNIILPEPVSEENEEEESRPAKDDPFYNEVFGIHEAENEQPLSEEMSDQSDKEGEEIPCKASEDQVPVEKTIMQKITEAGIDQDEILKLYDKLKDVMENEKLTSTQKNKMIAILLRK